jgi:hypothetical protein
MVKTFKQKLNYLSDRLNEQPTDIERVILRLISFLLIFITLIVLFK